MKALTLLPLASLLFVLGTVPAQAQPLPAHPNDLVFPELSYEPPVPEGHRFVMKNGVVVYVVEDHRVPLVDVNFTIHADAKQEPEALVGLHTGMFELMGRGGSQAHDAAWIEEEVAFLGARLDTGMDSYGGALALQSLTKDLDRGLDLAFELLRTPGFQEDRLQQWKDERLAAFKERNDDPERLERQEWRRLMYQPATWRAATAATVAAIDRKALLDWHQRWVQPEHITVTAYGDISARELLPRLERRMKGWKGQSQRFTSPDPEYRDVQPGVYLVNKPVNQSRVRCFLPGLDRDDERWLPAYLLNELLGGGGMSSALLNRIRTKEGLAYSVGSQLEERTFGQGLLWAAFQTKTESTQFAMSLLVDEVEKMARGEISQENLDNAKAQLIQAFPTWFSSAGTIASSLTEEELSGRMKRNPRHYRDLRAKVQAVSLEDVRRVAAELLRPERLVWVVVGDATAIMQPDAEHQLTLEGFGAVTRVPLRDPLSQEPLPLD